MKLAPYLLFNGNCAEAFRFYERVLGGRIDHMQTHRDSPAANNVPAEWQDKILHVHLAIGASELMGSDAPPQYREEQKGFFVSLQYADIAEGERVFNALAKNGKVTMPFGKTFWAERFGMLVDRFGTPWSVSCAPAA